MDHSGPSGQIEELALQERFDQQPMLADEGEPVLCVQSRVLELSHCVAPTEHPSQLTPQSLIEQ